MSENAKHKHLALVHSTINRFSNNGFQIKGWTVTLIAAILALVVNNDSTPVQKGQMVLIAFMVVILFWLLDGYFLWQERMFRELYKNVATRKNSEIDFQMNISSYNTGHNTWASSVVSKVLLIFYLTLLIVMSVVSLVIT